MIRPEASHAAPRHGSNHENEQAGESRFDAAHRLRRDLSADLVRAPVMRAFLLGFGLLLSLVDHSFADEQIQVLGTWKLVSWVLQVVATKEISYPYGEHPRGVLIFTPSGRAIVMLTGEGRKVPQTDEERSAAFRSLVAYSGQYRLEGDKWILKPDVAWNEGWVGTEQVRYFRREGDRLYIRTNPQPMINFGNEIAVSTQIWDKEE